MLNTKTLLALVLLTLSLTPALALADEGVSASYALKKQNRVHFQGTTEDEATSTDVSATDAVAPADIEPAAGDFEQEQNQDETSVSQMIKLPRKN